MTVTLTAGGKEVASAKETLADGASYTIVAGRAAGSKPQFKVYRAGKPVPGKASVRAVNAAPELGRVSMSLSGQDWGTVGLRPGHRLQARRPRDLRPLGDEAGHEVRPGHARRA